MVNYKKTTFVTILRRLIIFLYGVSLCFGTFALTGSSRNFTISLIIAILYILSLLPLIGSISIVFKRFSKYIVPILLFFILLCINNWLNINQYDVPVISITILSCIVLFIFMLLHSIFDVKAINYAMYGYMLGAFILSLLFIMGIGIYVEFGVDIREGERMSMFGQNQNELGLIMTNGITLILMLIILYDKWDIGIMRYIAILPIISMFVLLFGVASRAAFISIAVILISIVFLHKTRSIYTRILFFVIGIIGFWYAYQYFISSESLMFSRMMQMYESGNSSGRTEIWGALMPRLMETPIMGVGQTGYSLIAHQELVSIAGNMYENGFSPHNVLIEVFAYTGLIGLSLMLLFWLKLFRDGITCYKYINNLIPLLLLIPVAVYIMSGQILGNKFAWLLYVYIIDQANLIKNELFLKNHKLKNYEKSSLFYR